MAGYRIAMDSFIPGVVEAGLKASKTTMREAKRYIEAITPVDTNRLASSYNLSQVTPIDGSNSLGNGSGPLHLSNFTEYGGYVNDGTPKQEAHLMIERTAKHAAGKLESELKREVELAEVK